MKKWIAMVLILTTLLTLCACGANYFREAPDLKTPDSVVDGATFYKMDDGIYIYRLADNEKDAVESMADWNAYIQGEGYSVKGTISGGKTIFKVLKGGDLFALFMLETLNNGDYGMYWGFGD